MHEVLTVYSLWIDKATTLVLQLKFIEHQIVYLLLC